MRKILLIIALFFCGHSWSDEPVVHEAITQKEQSANQKKNSSNFDTTSLEKTIRESIKEATEKPDANSNEKLESDRKLAEYTGQLAIFTKWLAFATFILAGIAIWQGWLLKRTVNLGREEFNSTHRPQIRIKHLWLNEPIESGKQIIVNLVVVNHGNTEARHIQGEIATFIAPSIDYLPAKPTFTGRQVFGVQSNTIPSGMTIEFEQLSDGRPLTKEDVSAIKGGGSKLYCFGYVDYQDTSNRIRKTAFCRVLQLLPLIPSEYGRFKEPKEQNLDYEYHD